MKVAILVFFGPLFLVFVPVLAEEGEKRAGFVEGAQLPPRFGVGVDFFIMNQPYAVESLGFSLPGMELPPVDPTRLEVENDIQNLDIKVDFWLLPYLNLFAVLGKVNGTTSVDLSSAGLPLPIGEISIDLDGKVYGGGATLALAGKRFFGSLTGSLTNTDLEGEFESCLQTLTMQPRAGVYGRFYQVWAGGIYLDTDESHSGTIPLYLGGPAPVPVQFDVSLEDDQAWSPMLGGALHLNRHFSLLVEGGFGDRRPFLANLTCRF